MPKILKCNKYGRKKKKKERKKQRRRQVQVQSNAPASRAQLTCNHQPTNAIKNSFTKVFSGRKTETISHVCDVIDGIEYTKLNTVFIT